MAKLILDRVLKKREMSKRQFAILIDKPYYAVFRYFREGYDPKLSVLTFWAKKLKVRVRDLIED